MGQRHRELMRQDLCLEASFGIKKKKEEKRGINFTHRVSAWVPHHWESGPGSALPGRNVCLRSLAGRWLDSVIYSEALQLVTAVLEGDT